MAKTMATQNRVNRDSATPGVAMTPAEFSRKWGPEGTAHRLNERAGAQKHFVDLCKLLGVDEPEDPDSYCFERGLWGIDGGIRFADVWKRGHFAWEYKAPGGDLRKALNQLMRYAMRLDNPPLLIVSDRRTIQIHTHFTGHPSVCFDIAHAELQDPRKLNLLRSAFEAPRTFLPPKTTHQVTAELAASIARIAESLRARGEPSMRAAHFLTQCIFCCFAESVEVLPGDVFRRVLQKRQTPASLQRNLTQLFNAMCVGDDFGVDSIPWFNGGLFKAVDVPLLEPEEIKALTSAAATSWASIDPSILGTLFERGLDPAKRSQLGAHYTDAATIERLIDPVVRRPLLAEWDGIKREIAGLMSKRDVLLVRAKGVPSKTEVLKKRHAALRSHGSRAVRKAEALHSGFMDRLQSFRVLDPACGSGNFLFLALKALKDIEHLVNNDAQELGLGRQFSVTGPQNLLGLEINEYAAELARATVWIGELKWRKEHGYGWKENPILDPLDQIECRDALLAAPGGAAVWPDADVVVGNPPFVGDKKMRSELGDVYTEQLRTVYKGRVPGGADLVCFWFERARSQIEAGKLQMAGLVATNSIRGGANREVLSRICKTTRIFEAWKDEAWVNDGAAVRVSLVGFGGGNQGSRIDGMPVESINADLSGNITGGDALDLTGARNLLSNRKATFVGGMKKGQFDISGSLARVWLRQPNPNGRSNAEVVLPWQNGLDVTRRPLDMWIIDFGVDRAEAEAALFEIPFAYAKTAVKPARDAVRNDLERKLWWLHARSAPDLRSAVRQLPRYIATARVAKHRLFVWQRAPLVVDGQLVITARADDTTLGLLHSRFHELWSLRLGTSLEDRPRYTPTTCFETFPFPVGLTPADTGHQCTEALPDGAVIPAQLSAHARVSAESIASAAARLVALRDLWLNPPEWTEHVPEVVPLGMKSSPYPDRVIARPGFEKQVAQRTLTNLYNERPTWLAQAHDALDMSVAAAYGWSDYTPAMADEEILARLLRLNHQRTSERAPSAQMELPLPPGIVGQQRAEQGSDRKMGQAPTRPRTRAA